MNKKLRKIAPAVVLILAFGLTACNQTGETKKYRTAQQKKSR